jgi:hypothetical protein
VNLTSAAADAGAEAHDRDIAQTMPYLTESGAELLFFGEGGAFLIGPKGESWDRAMLFARAA